MPINAYTVSKIATIVDGTLLGKADYHIKYIETDSRKIRFPAEAMFFCLQSNQRNGHDYIPSCYAMGVRCFMVTNMLNAVSYPNSYPDTAFIIVDDVLKALQQLTATHRSQFHYPIIGITGSNGKTIVKEWLNHLLQTQRKIVRSPKSFNSQIGVPLSVWQLSDDYNLGIFEAGISTVGEMDKLAHIIYPTIGILTHMGDAHNEGFSSLQAKILEKLQLFEQADILIYNQDQPQVCQIIDSWKQGKRIQIVTVGSNPLADFRVYNIQQRNAETQFQLHYLEENIACTIPFMGMMAIENALLAVASAIIMGCSSNIIVERLAHLPTLAMRLEMKMGINNCTIINDSYSADISALTAALEFLSQQPQHTKKTLILSDIVQSGQPEEKLYSQLASLLPRYGVNRLIGIGTVIGKYLATFVESGLQTSIYPSTSDFLQQFNSEMCRDESILLKGARSFQFEQINQLLEIKWHQTVLSVNLSAISSNLMLYKKAIPKGVRLMIMVKALSYGSGSFEIASVLQFHKVDYLAVAYADEGVALREAGIHLPIMVMNPEETSFPSMLKYHLEPEIFSIELLQSFQQFLMARGVENFPIHIKIDTGMHRLGFEADEISALGNALILHNTCSVKTVFSHLAGSESPAEDVYTYQQNAVFIAASDQLEMMLGYSFLRHLANTAAIRRHPTLAYDMVRLGIGLYGVDASLQNKGLQEATQLTTTIAQVKKRKAGDTIGYNRAGKIVKDAVIATIRIGYADGYPRNLGLGKGYVLVQGKRAPIVGKICMDMMMVDITEIKGVKTGDEVVLYGKGISIIELAGWAETIPYHIMAGIASRVKRIYYEE
jgi:alanine racemase